MLLLYAFAFPSRVNRNLSVTIKSRRLYPHAGCSVPVIPPCCDVAAKTLDTPLCAPQHAINFVVLWNHISKVLSLVLDKTMRVPRINGRFIAQISFSTRQLTEIIFKYKGIVWESVEQCEPFTINQWFADSVTRCVRRRRYCAVTGRRLIVGTTVWPGQWMPSMQWSSTRLPLSPTASQTWFHYSWKGFQFNTRCFCFVQASEPGLPIRIRDERHVDIDLPETHGIKCSPQIAYAPDVCHDSKIDVSTRIKPVWARNPDKLLSITDITIFFRYESLPAVVLCSQKLSVVFRTSRPEFYGLPNDWRTADNSHNKQDK